MENIPGEKDRTGPREGGSRTYDKHGKLIGPKKTAHESRKRKSEKKEGGDD